jgi:hypothetical protein
MNEDNLISSIDFDKLKSDCLIHDFLKMYSKKKIDSNLMLGFRYFGAIFKKRYVFSIRV